MLVHIIVGPIVGFALLGTELPFVTASEAASLRGALNIDSGSVCIGVQNTDTDHFLTDMQRHGAQLIRFPKGDIVCQQFGENNLVNFGIPNGLEAWTVRTAKQLGYTSARYSRSTTGGSGYLRRMLDANLVFSTSVTPKNLGKIREAALCGLQTKLHKYYDEVVTKPCPNSSFPNDDLCFRFWLGGHTSKTPGFRPQLFGNHLDNGYWVSERAEVWLGNFQDGEDRAAQLGVVILSSVYARMPPSAHPQHSDFHAIDQFDPSVSSDELDEALNESLMNNLASGNFQCDG